MNIELLQKCYNDYTIKKSTYNKMYQYYNNESDKIKNYSAQEYQESHTMNLNFIKKFVKEEVSYSVGTPISYNSKVNNNDNIISDINYYTYHWDRKHDSELLKNILIFGTAYELYFIDREGQFSAKAVKPQNGYAYIDDFGNVLFFLHIYTMKFDTNTYIDVYDDQFIYHYDSSFKEIRKPDTHIFKQVPISIGEISEEAEKDTLYSDLKDVQDGLSLINCDGVNEITNTRNAILKGKGFDISGEDAVNLRKYRFANLPEGDSDLGWLIKNLNPAYQQLMMEKLEDTLYKLSFHINSQESMQSNTSSLALRTRLINLEQKTKLNNKSLENVIIKRLYFLFYYLKILKNKDYDYRTISIKFNSVIPSDDLMIAQIISQMGDKLSLKTALKNFSWVENVDAEMEEIKKENENIMQGQSLLDKANGSDS